MAIFDRYSKMLQISVICEALLVTCALTAAPNVSKAREPEKDSAMVFWRFEEFPGADFSVSKSWEGNCATTAKTIGTASLETSPRYGKPAPDVGGQSSLLLNNKATVDNEGGYLISDPLPEMKGNSGLTVEAWINPATIKLSGILHTIGPKGDNQLFLQLREDGSLRFLLTRLGVVYGIASPVGSISANKWSHIAIVFGPTRGFLIYINGKISGVRNKEKAPWPNMSGSFGRLTIGAYVRNEGLTSAAYFYDGQIDEIRITGRELDSGEFWLGGNGRQ
jgi:hypothetical protein